MLNWTSVPIVYMSYVVYIVCRFPFWVGFSRNSSYISDKYFEQSLVLGNYKFSLGVHSMQLNMPFFSCQLPHHPRANQHTAEGRRLCYELF